MTTNKPGSETQQPLYCCTSCYDECAYPADHLRVYNGECWCESCWEYATHEIADGLDWGDLEPFRPVLNTEYEKLQTEYEQLVSYTKNGIECFANPCPEHSGVNTPPFSEFQERYGQLCLMCVVDERDTLRAECEKLRKDAERYRWLRDPCSGNLKAAESQAQKNREAVARAICTACDENPDFRGDARGNEYRWQDYLEIAEAAMAAGIQCAPGQTTSQAKAKEV